MMSKNARLYLICMKHSEIRIFLHVNTKNHFPMIYFKYQQYYIDDTLTQLTRRK